jgi:hypothetical protein
LDSTKHSALFTAENQRKAVAGEAAALESFTNDMYGCNDPALKEKRSVTYLSLFIFSSSQ